jgi:hypothetical protein
MQDDARVDGAKAAIRGRVATGAGGLVGCYAVVWSFLLASVIMMAIPQNGSASEPFVGMWVWKLQWINTATEQDRLIAFCQEHRISRLLVNVPFGGDGSEPGARNVQYQRELGRLLALARDAGITIEALDSGTSIGPEQQAKLMAKLDALLAFNATLPADARFVGVHYDIEPHITDAFRESYASRVVIMRDLLTFYAEAKDKLRQEAPGMTLACDIAMWFDGRTEGERSCMVEFRGETKNLQAHIQDLTDYVGVMSYRRFATGNNSVTHHIKTEVDYANKIGRGVCAGVETGKKTADPTETSTISFYGLPSDFFWGEVDKIHQTYRDQPGYHGVLIHCYSRFQEYLKDNPPKGE